MSPGHKAVDYKTQDFTREERHDFVIDSADKPVTRPAEDRGTTGVYIVRYRESGSRAIHAVKERECCSPARRYSGNSWIKNLVAEGWL